MNESSDTPESTEQTPVLRCPELPSHHPENIIDPASSLSPAEQMDACLSGHPRRRRA